MKNSFWLWFFTCERFGICMGGAVGADIEILVWLLLLANWLGNVLDELFRKVDPSFCQNIFSSPGWQGWGPRWAACWGRAWWTSRRGRSRQRSAGVPHLLDSTQVPKTIDSSHRLHLADDTCERMMCTPEQVMFNRSYILTSVLTCIFSSPTTE